MILERGNFSNSRLLTSLVLAITLFAIFIFVPHSLGFPTLDSTASPVMARKEIALMTHAQRIDHLALTAIVDSLFPLAYGFLFLGAAERFWGRLALPLAVLIAILVATDFLENAVQILGLLGWSNLLVAKSFLTPLKFILFFAGWVMVILSIPLALIRKTSKN
jgi:hypothetical protein